jgi:hypothetical protein
MKPNRKWILTILIYVRIDGNYEKPEKLDVYVGLDL